MPCFTEQLETRDRPPSPAAPASPEWDAVAIGAGPSGALAARQLALLGLRVLLVDKAAFPRGKVCGCCLNGAALGVLRAAGLGGLIDRLGARPLTKARIAAGRRRAELPLDDGAAVSRETLDAALVAEAIAAGAHFLPETTALVGPASATARLVTLGAAAASRTIAAGVVLVADGLSGQALRDLPEFAPSVAVDARVAAGTVLDDGEADYADGTIHLACGRSGYLGLVRLEDGRLDLAAAFDREALRRAGQPAALAAEILREAHLPVPADFDTAQWRGTVALTRRRTRLAGERLFLLGDAAGYVEPFTGEGMAWALSSALLVAPLAAEASGNWSRVYAQRWERAQSSAFGAARRRCRWIALGLRSPRVAALGVAALGIAPWLAAPVVRRLNRPVRGVRSTLRLECECAPVVRGLKSTQKCVSRESESSPTRAAPP